MNFECFKSFLLLLLLSILPYDSFSQMSKENIFKEIIITKDAFHNSFPSVIKLKSGRILIGYRKGISHLSPNSKCVIKYSIDNGNSFSKEIVVDNGKDFTKTTHGIRNLILNELDNGKLLAIYWVNDNKNGAIYYRMSNDEGNSWNDRKSINVNNIKASLIGVESKLIELEGKYILPVFFKPANANNLPIRAGVLLSQDFNKWSFHQVSGDDSNNNESIVLKDQKENKLIYFYRNVTKNALYRSFSVNSGKTWVKPKNVSFLGYVQSRPDITFFPKKGIMYLLYREGKYQTGSIAYSLDKGLTWSKSMSFQTDNSRFTYGELIKTGIGKKLLIYSSENAANGNTSVIKGIVFKE